MQACTSKSNQIYSRIIVFFNKNEKNYFSLDNNSKLRYGKL